MKPLIYRDNRLFCINEEQLSEKARNTNVVVALYAAVFYEFRGADKNDKYKNLTYEQRLERVNEFAWEWLEGKRLK